MVATIRTIIKVRAAKTRPKVSKRLGEAVGASEGKSSGSAFDPVVLAEPEFESNKGELDSIPKDLLGKTK
jgi:hypothetical protein